jgi:hypothetical protein
MFRIYIPVEMLERALWLLEEEEALCQHVEPPELPHVHANNNNHVGVLATFRTLLPASFARRM